MLLLWLIGTITRWVITVLVIFYTIIFMLQDKANIKPYRVTIIKVRIVLGLITYVLSIFVLIINIILGDIQKCVTLAVLIVNYVMMTIVAFRDLKKTEKDLIQKNNDNQ